MARSVTDADARIDLFNFAIDRGVTTFDTAPLYGFGAAEEQLGIALQDVQRDQVQILTKVGLRWGDGDHGQLHFEFANADGKRVAVRRNSRPESIRWEVEQSLKRLNVEVLDLVQIHFRDLETPLDESIGALLELRTEGKLREVGVSNFTPEEMATAQAAMGHVLLASAQLKYNLLQKGIERESLPWCRDNRVAVIAYSPLAEGLLAGQASNRSIPKKVQRVLSRIAAMATEEDVPMAALALRWLIEQDGVTAVIGGASSCEQLDEQLQALTLDSGSASYGFLTEAVAGVRLAEEWEGPRWKQAVRSVKARLMNGIS